MNARQKGLAAVHKVKKILQARGETVEGPGFRPAYNKKTKKMFLMHSDYFGAYDLMSFSKDKCLYGIQVCSLDNKQRNARKIYESGNDGELWCYMGKEGFNVYLVTELDGKLHIELLEEGVK